MRSRYKACHRAYTAQKGLVPLCSAQDLSRHPDKQAGTNRADDEIGDQSVCRKSDHTEHKAAHKGTDDTHDNISDQTTLQTHDLSGDPAHDGTHDQ